MRNLIVGCVYWHPGSDISIPDFTNPHLSPIPQTISIESKQCVLMGDFNVDLLTNQLTQISPMSFTIACLYSTFFTPLILQLTRLHSKTLIGNIFFNLLDDQSEWQPVY